MPAPAVPLTLALPAATALWKYLDARYALRADASMLSVFLRTTLAGVFLEKKDRVSAFYTLEKWATDPKTADKDFLLFAGKSWSYKAAYEQALKHGAWVGKRFGIKKNEVVAMDFVNSETFLWTWFGLWAIGAKPAFVNYNLADRPLLHCIRTSGARVVLVDTQVKDKYSGETLSALSDPAFRTDGGGVEVALFTPEVKAEIAGTPPTRAPDAARSGQLGKDMAILIYTSGTTGLPKPAVVSWAKAALAPSFVAGWMPIRADDIMYTCMPLYHSSAALLACMSVVQAGATFSLGARFHRSTFWDDVRATHATIIQYVGETCRYLLSAPESPLDKQHSVRVAFGNGLRPDVWPRFKSRFNIDTIAEFYAATEGPAAMWNKSRNEFTAGAVGRSGLIASTLLGKSSVVVRLDYEANTPLRDPKTGLCIRCPLGEPGELLYKLDEKDIEKAYQGYYHNTGATKSKIVRGVLAPNDAYFSTGDILRKDSDGRWFFLDRIGDTFRWKSENVSTAEVSEVLGRVSGVAEANVYGVSIPGHDGRAGCAAIILNEGVEKDGAVPEAQLAALAQGALAGLPRYAVPVFLRIMREETVEAGHRTGTNKQQKHHLREEGVDPTRVPDAVYWLPPGEKVYRRFGAEEWSGLGGGRVKL
ncbi:fatty acid transporter, variant, partial [Trichodelitschia bisporula]